jgi:hypothetical protein
VSALDLTAVAVLAAGALLVMREVHRDRLVSRTALAGDLLALAGAAWSAVLVAAGPLWPLAVMPALCALVALTAAVHVLDAWRKGVRR